MFTLAFLSVTIFAHYPQGRESLRFIESRKAYYDVMQCYNNRTIIFFLPSLHVVGFSPWATSPFSHSLHLVAFPHYTTSTDIWRQPHVHKYNSKASSFPGLFCSGVLCASEEKTMALKGIKFELVCSVDFLECFNSTKGHTIFMHINKCSPTGKTLSIVLWGGGHSKGKTFFT